MFDSVRANRIVDPLKRSRGFLFRSQRSIIISLLVLTHWKILLREIINLCRAELMAMLSNVGLTGPLAS